MDREFVQRIVARVLIAVGIGSVPFIYYYANALRYPAATMVVINEIRSQGNSGDWVELYNRSAETVRLDGFAFRDNRPDREAYRLPAGIEIAPGGFYVLDTFGFGLGDQDAAILLGWGGGVIVDAHYWNTHPPASTTRGRCPDGSGDFEVIAPSRGEQNCAG